MKKLNHNGFGKSMSMDRPQKRRAEAGIVLITLDDVTLSSTMRFAFKASNNVTEYEALLVGLRLAKSIGAQKIHIFSDSQLIVNQIKGEFQAKEGNMISYMERAKGLLTSFSNLEIEQVPREMNAIADALTRLASGTDVELGQAIPIELLKSPSIDQKEQVMDIEYDHSWMEPICKYLTSQELPFDPIQAKQVIARSARYEVENGYMYKMGFGRPFLRCLNPTDAHTVLKDVHDEIAEVTLEPGS